MKELPLIPNVIPEIPPIDEVAIANQEEDDYQMEVEEEDLAERNGKKNHTWEETAMQLQLPLSTSEMSHIAIPSQWLSADEYLRLFTEMENGTSLFPLYDLGVDVHQVTYHPNFIYMHPCPAIYFLRCEHLKNGRPMFGFPRIKNVSKQYTWKKQGFTTAIPKSNPCVRYITANCYLCGRGKNRARLMNPSSLIEQSICSVRWKRTRAADARRNENPVIPDEGKHKQIPERQLHRRRWGFVFIRTQAPSCSFTS